MNTDQDTTKPKVNQIEFDARVVVAKTRAGYRDPLAFGVGIATLSSTGEILDTRFLVPNFSSNFGTAALLAQVVEHISGTDSYILSDENVVSVLDDLALIENDGRPHANIDAIKSLKKVSDAIVARNAVGEIVVRKVLVVSFIGQDDTGPKTVSDAYLRLHLLSHRLVKPHGIKVDGIFGVLPNVAHTLEGPIALYDLPLRQLEAMSGRYPLVVHDVDKFPRMVDYHVPSGVRIADGSRVRLGAYLGEGTTVMHEGFVNFNAGTQGPAMIEGRISAGVFVRSNTDLGGGCSTMGTLSGGNKEVISVGKCSLIGANAGIGISLGDYCSVEAGLYVTAGTKVTFVDKDGVSVGSAVKAKTLSGRSGLTFRRNSLSGQVEVLESANTVELNPELHNKV